MTGIAEKEEVLREKSVNVYVTECARAIDSRLHLTGAVGEACSSVHGLHGIVGSSYGNVSPD